MASIVEVVLLSCMLMQERINADDEIDFTFRHYCKHPANFGKGVFNEKDSTCTISYNVKVATDALASSFCDMQHPFSLDTVKRTAETIMCKIRSHYKCESTEILIGSTCFYPKRTFGFTKDECGRRHKLHVVKSVFEQKWIAAFMTTYKMAWVANDPTQLNNVQVANLGGKVMHGTEGHIIDRKQRDSMAIITSRGVKSIKEAIPVGRLTYVTKETPLVILCSRQADVLESYTEAMISKLSEVGITAYSYKDNNGKLRPFYIPRQLVSFVTSGRTYTDSQRHHKICEIFMNGYAATPFDFYNVEDMKNMLKLDKVNIVATPGRASPTLPSITSCSEGGGQYTSHRSHFNIVFQDSTSQGADVDRIWRSNYPNRACADTPRIALGFSKEGLVDIPASARLFPMCTFGARFKRKMTSKEGKCHSAAHYNKNTDTCTCDKPDSDLHNTKLFQTTEDDLKKDPGTMCIECETNTAQRTVVVFDLLYNTEHVLRFVQRLLFCFAKTESNPLLIGYGGKAFTFERYLRHSEHPYEIWREARNYFLSHATDRREQHYGPLGAFEHLVKNDIFSDVPRHKRTLIFITSGKNLEESKEKEYIDKFKSMGVKILPVGYEDAEESRILGYSTLSKAFYLGRYRSGEYNYGYNYAVLHEMVTYVDQLLTRNVCARS